MHSFVIRVQHPDSFSMPADMCHQQQHETCCGQVPFTLIPWHGCQLRTSFINTLSTHDCVLADECMCVACNASILSTALRLAGKVVAGMDGSIHSRDDVARLTAALTRASLPMHYRVTLDSERVAQ